MDKSDFNELELINIQNHIFQSVDKIGIQNRSDGTEIRFEQLRNSMNQLNLAKIVKGEVLSWAELMSEQYYALMAQVDEEKIIVDASQLAAICLLWALDIRSRKTNENRKTD